MEAQELRPGLWRWTAPHPDWQPGDHWSRDVACVYAELPEALVVVDPLIPVDEEERFFQALDKDVERVGKPVVVLLTAHWHERSTAEVVDRYKGSLWRPESGEPLPAGVRPEIVKGTDWVEALLYLEPYHALVAGDLLVGEGDGVQIPVQWFPAAERDWAERDLKPRLRALLELPIELVLVSHGDPVLESGHDALERALA